MPKVNFINEKKEIEVPAGSNLRTEARKAGINLYQGPETYLNCRGLGLCGTCKVLIKKGMENLNSKTILERANFNLHPLSMLSVLGQEEEMRLACQVTVNEDCTVQTHPGFNWSGENFWQKPYPNK